MKRTGRIMAIIIVFIAVLTSCTQNNKDEIIKLQEEIAKLNKDAMSSEEKIMLLEQNIKDLEFELNNLLSGGLLTTAIEVMESIKAEDMTELSQYVHPNLGVRFTPYFYIDIQNDQVFTSQQIIGLMQDNQIYNWGIYDGSGELIDLKFSDYYDLFVYDKDFVNPQIIGNNVALGKGNIADNIVAAYPNGQFIEFHFSMFDPQYEGADWESLRLVFEKLNNTWYLVGIVHGQWTV